MTDNLKLGIQLYSVKDLTDEEEFKQTVKALADMGFEGVEFAWKYGGMPPQELATFLDSVGLLCGGLHVKLHEVLDPKSAVYDIALACQSPFITTSLCRRMDTWRDLIPQLENAGKTAASRGLQFTYHNHFQEFVKIDGVYALNCLP